MLASHLAPVQLLRLCKTPGIDIESHSSDEHVDMLSKEEAVLQQFRRNKPLEVLAVSPVPSHPRRQNGNGSLPLNIIAEIISYVR